MKHSGSGGGSVASGNTPPLPAGASTETTLLAVLAAVDGLEGYTDGIESLLTSIRDGSVPNTSYVATSIIVGTSQVALPTTALTNRKLLIIENKSGANIFYGPSGITTTTGLRLVNNAVVSVNVGPAITIYALRSAGSGDVTVHELS